MSVLKSNCTGCGACEAICPVSCITMRQNDIGENVPDIDEKRCLHCDKCKTVCPQRNPPQKLVSSKCYAAYRTDEIKRLKSASGGIASVLGEFFLNSGTGKQATNVWGVGYNQQLIPEFMCAKNADELEKFKGSKYVQAIVGMAYETISRQLERGESVLFVGTPCQVAALLNYSTLKSMTEKLYTVDLLCHGVCPTSYFCNEIEYLRKKSVIHIDDVVFRSNDKSQDFFFTVITNKDRVFSRTPAACQPYFYSFLGSVSLRESCYDCLYTSKGRCSDITIGDFFGLGTLKYPKYTGKKNNVSVVLTNTLKGQKLFESVRNELYMAERPADEAYNGRSVFSEPCRRHVKREAFISAYKRCGNFSKAIRLSCGLRINKNRVLRYVNFVLRKAGIRKQLELKY